VHRAPVHSYSLPFAIVYSLCNHTILRLSAPVFDAFPPPSGVVVPLSFPTRRRTRRPFPCPPSPAPSLEVHVDQPPHVTFLCLNPGSGSSFYIFFFPLLIRAFSGPTNSPHLLCRRAFLSSSPSGLSPFPLYSYHPLFSFFASP